MLSQAEQSHSSGEKGGEGIGSAFEDKVFFISASLTGLLFSARNPVLKQTTPPQGQDVYLPCAHLDIEAVEVT